MNWRDLFHKPDPETEKAIREEPKEKKDIPAMLLAAFFTLFLPAVVVLLLFAGLIVLLFSL